MQIEAINPFALPSLSIPDREQLPSVSGIYFVLCGNTVIYVGRARNLQHRWKGAAHHRLSQVSALGGARIAWLMAEESICDSIEQACIAYFAPALNQTPVQRTQRQRNTRLRLTVHNLVSREDARRVAQGMGPLTQQEIARGTGISQAVISTLLRNTATRLDLKTIRGLCVYFRVTPGDLFDYVPDE
jgi:DNA-binding Xre family transcriptional regulator